MGEISDALLEAYRDTDYVVSAQNGFTLRVGVTCPALDRLLLAVIAPMVRSQTQMKNFRRGLSYW